MKKLSEFHGKAATDLIGKILISISKIFKNEDNKKAYAEDGAAALIGSALINTPEGVVGILAALNEVPVEEYDYTAVTLIKDAYGMLTDQELVMLFGSQS